ncbi:MAG: type II toxin-antitoxin system VapC family toxin [Candidatus Korarchaeota archaeon NZ13-K]|nr:MAG: type II toxin-antitoxin system VapC family toxin [Candidatus Korarchaeota archaeon NZ13-K]
MRLVLDTSFLLELRKGKYSDLLREESVDVGDVGISILSLYELLVGAYYLREKGDYSELLWLDSLLRWVSIYPLDEEGIRLAAQLKANSMRRGDVYPDMDLLIATSVRPSKILTCDEDHERMRDELREHGIEVVMCGKGHRGKRDA